MQKQKPFLGHSVKNGKLRYTSVSAIKMFDARTEGCKRKWAFRYVFGKKVAKIGAQTEGILHAEQLEHYLTTGQDTLPPVLFPAKKFFPKPGPDLECEQALGDMKKALELRDIYLNNIHSSTQAILSLRQDIHVTAGLSANVVPLDGAADIRHIRGEFIDADGNFCKEPSDIKTFCVDDLKTVSRIYPHKIMSGEKAGQTIPAYTLTDAEVAHDIQMLGYARHGIDKYPWATHARLGLIYANTKRREATKRMALISRDQILERWHGQGGVEDTVREMEQTAAASKIEDIEPNVKACDAFMHVDPEDSTGKKILKGCPHRYYCPLSIMQVGATMLGQHKENAMSLFDSVTNSAPLPPTETKTVDVVQAAMSHAAIVEMEKKRLLAEDAAVSLGFCAKCGAQLSSLNASKLPLGEIKHIGCVAVATAPLPPQSPLSVSPPDRPPPPTMLQAAAPVSQSALSEIQNPALRAEVEAHMQAHAEKARMEAEKEMSEKMTSSVWCSVSATKIVITTEVAVARKWTCVCGKTYALSLLKPVKEGDSMVSVIPRHRLKEKEGVVVAPVESKQIKITVEHDEEEEAGDDEDVVVPPPPVAAVVPPPPPLPVVGAMTEMVEKAFGNGNGHTNGNGHATQDVPVTVAPRAVAEKYRISFAGYVFDITVEKL